MAELNPIDDLFDGPAVPAVAEAAPAPAMTETTAAPDSEALAWVNDVAGFDVLAATPVKLNSLLVFHGLVVTGLTTMTIEQKRVAVASALYAKLSHGKALFTHGVDTTDDPVLDPEPEATVPAETKPEPKKKLTKKQQVEALDPILQIAHKVENLTEGGAKLALQNISESGAANEFELGGVLNTIQAHAWYAPHESFKKFVEAECTFGYRKAAYLIAIYTSILASGLTWVQVQSLGWSKLRVLSKYLTAENVSEVLAWAEGRTYAQIEAEAEGKWGVGGEKSPTIAAPVTSKTFKLKAEQVEVVEKGLALAMAEAGTTVPSVGLERLCVAYISQGGAVKINSLPKAETDLAELFKTAGPEAILNAFAIAFPDIEIEASVPE